MASETELLRKRHRMLKIIPTMAESRGYHRLAEVLMGPYPEAAIFRRFGPLAMLNLLSLQAELVDLELEFRRIRSTDDTSNDPTERNFSSYFKDLHMSEGGNNARQYQLLMKIRHKLKEYYEALLQAAQVSTLAKPGKPDLEFLRGWIQGAEEGGDFLQAAEYFTWVADSQADPVEKKRLNRDMVMLYNLSADQDSTSQFVTSHLLDWYHRLWGSRRSARKRTKITDQQSKAMHYDEGSLLRVMKIIISMIASALPVMSIVALYFIKTTIQRIGALVAFTVLFALLLAVFTNARRLEIFATTSAFAAVEVVFIGTTIGNE